MPGSGKRGRDTALGYALLAPSLFGVATFLLLPMLVVVWLSLHRWDLLGPIEYVGLDNWRAVLTDSSFGNSLVVTVAFVALVVPTQMALGLVAASMLTRELPGSGVFRTLYVLPWVCAPLAIAVLWRWILAPTDGVVSAVLGRDVEWLTEPGLALPVVSAVTVWSNVGYTTLFFVAGMLAIPPQIRAAALLDGASAWQRFWRITLPLLSPSTFFVVVISLINGFQVFDQVYVMTGGGPSGSSQVVVGQIYDLTFRYGRAGEASALSWILFAVILVITVVQIRGQRKWVHYA